MGLLPTVVLLSWILHPRGCAGRALLQEEQESSALQGGISGESGTLVRNVTTCVELREALADVKVGEVAVVESMVCTSEEWPEPVMVRRNVDVHGVRVMHPLTKKSRFTSIDWTDVSNVVIAERGAVMYIYHLLIYQEEMGIGGLNLGFIQTRKGATGVFAGLVVVVTACPQRVNLYDQQARDLPRPEFLAGKQTTRAQDDESLLVKDVAIWWPNINSLWQICNTVFICGISSPTSPRVLNHFEQMSSATACDSQQQAIEEGAAKGSEPDVSSAENSGKGKKDVMGIAEMATVIVVVVGVVLLATIGTTYYVFGRRKRTAAWRKAEEGMLKNSRTGVKGDEHLDTDDVLQSHSAAYNLFENVDVPLQDVEIGPLLGRGGFGKVYKGTWKGTTVAIKVIEHGKRLMENDMRQPFEAYFSKHVSHPNVVQTFLIHTRQQDVPHGLAVDTVDLNADSLSRQNPPHQSSVMTTHDIFSNIAQGPAVQEVGEVYETWLVLEYCDKGSLSKAVRRGVLTDHSTMKPKMDHVILSALDVANSINYLHSLGITHGDLKADNVLLKSANTDRRKFFCKVSDFGLSRFMGPDDYIQTFTYGTITHMPPELLKDGILSPSVDVYSFGMLLWELLSKTEQPYPNKNHGEIILTVVNEGRRPQLGDHYPEMYSDLIRDCWKQNRFDRPNFPEIVRRLKVLLAEQDPGYGGSPSRSVSVPVNDSAASLRRRSDSGKKRNYNSNGLITPMVEAQTLIFTSSGLSRGKGPDTGPSTSSGSGSSATSDEGSQPSQGLQMPPLERPPVPAASGANEESDEDDFKSALSYLSGSEQGTPTHSSHIGGC